MATISILPNGSTSGNPNYKGNTSPEKRGETKGWTLQVSRRLRKWFYSVDTTQLTGHGLAFTLTVRDCPPTSDEWYRVRDALHKRLKAKGLIRMHWLTEWQRRGVPHLHGVAYFPEGTIHAIEHEWTQLTSKKYGSAIWAQKVSEVTGIVGWLDYLAKHSTRSAIHYQRSPENIPEGWTKTGRMWGKYGDWPIREPMSFQVCQQGFYAYRRIVHKLRVAGVRERLAGAFQHANAIAAAKPHLVTPVNGAIHLQDDSDYDDRQKIKKHIITYQNAKKELSSTRRLLKNNDSDQSRYKGTSNWLDQNDSIKIIAHLASSGYLVEQID